MLATDSVVPRRGQHRRRSQACEASEEQARSTQHSRRRSLSCDVLLGGSDSCPPSPPMPASPGLVQIAARSQVPDLPRSVRSAPNVLTVPSVLPGAQAHRARPQGIAGGSAPPHGTSRTGILAYTPGVAVKVATTGHIKSRSMGEKKKKKK